MAIRVYLESFRLPGEAQKINRIMESFGKAYHGRCPALFRNADAVYILAYSVILLNTDQHNSQARGCARPPGRARPRPAPQRSGQRSSAKLPLSPLPENRDEGREQILRRIQLGSHASSQSTAINTASQYGWTSTACLFRPSCAACEPPRSAREPPGPRARRR